MSNKNAALLILGKSEVCIACVAEKLLIYRFLLKIEHKSYK